MEITLQRTGVRRQCGQEVLATTETRAERAFYRRMRHRAPDATLDHREPEDGRRQREVTWTGPLKIDNIPISPRIVRKDSIAWERQQYPH